MPQYTCLADMLADNTMPAAPVLVGGDENGALQCLACGNRCRIAEGESGLCRMRWNRSGELRVPHGYVAGLQVDPIEKKPFFHVLPGRDALSFGMVGCNLHCSFCQNWVSSQTLKDDRAGTMPQRITAEEIVNLAVQDGAPVIVSTYNEPLITADWAVEVFKLAREHGIRCGFVSNGNATPEVIEFIRPHVDLYKVDLKTFDDAKYRELGCDRRNVLDTIERLHTMGFWVEVVTLVVPGFNDSDAELKAIAEFVVGVSCDIPWHVTAFHPNYKMTEERRTSVADLERAYTAGKEAGLRFVYSGNMPGRTGDRENTCCPECSAVLVRRTGFYIDENRMRGGQCPECNAAIPGVWEEETPKRGSVLSRLVRR
ncbi:MAG: AmmeMemoRadiSam system radical SAM enzyme [bacterium]|nr:AmmeMemoRadiSam system radical SAM enzyme [bacterium]